MFVEDYARITSKVGEFNGNVSFWLPNVDRNERVDVLNLTERAKNSLKRSKVMTMGELLDNFDNIKKFKNVGVTTVKNIKTSFIDYHYSKLSAEQKYKFWALAIKSQCPEVSA